jgi:hypothetical protein
MDGMRSDSGRILVEAAAPALDQGPTRGDRPAPADGPGRQVRPVTQGELRELVKRAQQGDQTALPLLRQVLDASPDLWKYCGDAAKFAEGAWIEVLAGRDQLRRESLLRTVAALKTELAGPSAPPLERLLAGRVVACWLQAAQADASVAQSQGRGLTAAQLDSVQRRQERSQRSYLAAIKALATVRKLALPVAEVAVVAAQAGTLDRPGRHEADDPDRRERGEGRPTASGGSRPRRSRKPACKDAVGSGREASLPEPILERMRGLVGVEAEN